MWRKNKTIFIALSILLSTLLIGCGGSDDAEGTGGEAPATEVTIEGSNWEFDSDTYTIPAGEPVAIHYVNAEGSHGISIAGTDVDLQDDERATVNLEPGEYTIACSIMCGTGHADMVATLIVE